MTPAWVHLIDVSLAVTIAAAAGYAMFRLFASTEVARRAQMTELVRMLFDQVGKRQEDQTAELRELREAVLALRDEVRHGRR